MVSKQAHMGCPANFRVKRVGRANCAKRINCVNRFRMAIRVNHVSYQNSAICVNRIYRINCINCAYFESYVNRASCLKNDEHSACLAHVLIRQGRKRRYAAVIGQPNGVDRYFRQQAYSSAAGQRYQ